MAGTATAKSYSTATAMTIDQALDILRKCCENIDIDDNGHERECGKCEVCRAISEIDGLIADCRKLVTARVYVAAAPCICPKGEPFMPTNANCPRHGLGR